MKRGEIWWVDLEPTQGKEQRGHRPVLVISHTRFNDAAGIAIVCPITSGGAFARNRGFAVSLEDAGTTTRGVILAHQVRVLDVTARRGRFIEAIPAKIVADVVTRLQIIIADPSP